MSREITGVVPPVVTPLTDSRELDVASFERNIERMIAAGVNGLFFLGSSGEVAFSPDARRDEVLREGVRIVNGRVPVLAGVIDTQTERVVEHVKRAVDMGVDAVVSTAPFYALAGPAQVERHFEVIGEKSPVPVYAYDLPVCVHVKLDVAMLVRLGKSGAIAGVKDSSGDDISFRRLVIANRDAGSPLKLLTGHEIVVDGAYLSGADGSVPGLANVDPEGYVRQWRAAQAGNWAEVVREQDRLTRLMDITSVVQGVQGYGAGVGAFKTALMLLGVFETNQMSEPVSKLEGDNVEAVARVLREAGLLS